MEKFKQSMLIFGYAAKGLLLISASTFIFKLGSNEQVIDSFKNSGKQVEQLERIAKALENLKNSK